MEVGEAANEDHGGDLTNARHCEHCRREIRRNQRQTELVLRGIRGQLNQTIGMLRKLLVDYETEHRLSPLMVKESGKQFVETKRRILTEMMGDPELRALLGLRLTRRKSASVTARTQRLVDCEQRKELCAAACCRLSFALTSEEVRAGHMQWSLIEPFVRAVGVDGYCAHLDRKTMQCGIYEHRPAVCRRYSCQGDKRIWEDYDGQILSRRVPRITGMAPTATEAEGRTGDSGPSNAAAPVSV